MASAQPERLDGSHMAMPLLLINMGGEMLYILEQRLVAQKINEEKSARVLQDVIRTMFARKFIDELFRPQPLYSRVSIRQIFDKLAHSSIMRLNTNSMDKLYDLMTMGFKFQITSCTSPEQLYQVTLKHLDSLINMVRPSPGRDLLLKCKDMFNEAFSHMPVGEWFALRTQLASFFRTRRVKISLFLQTKLQDTSGKLAIRFLGPLPRGADIPGNIKCTAKQHVLSEHTFVSRIDTRHCYPFDTYEDDSPMALGGNLYRSEVLPLLLAAAESEPQQHTSSESRAEAKHEGRTRRVISPAESKASAVAELNVLAGLMGAAAKEVDTGPGDSGAIFSLNLFENTDRGIFETSEPPVQHYELDTKADHKGAAQMMEELDLKEDLCGDAAEEKGAEDSEDDLLDLMDAASMGHK